jgi:hypothetical protein
VLGGCIPFATPKLLNTNSRGDVAAETRNVAEAGRANRVDVLLALGEPDGRGIDDRWFTYASSRTSEVGTVTFLLVSGFVTEHVSTTTERLVIRFDSAGIVSKTDLEESNCAGFMVAQGCLDMKGRDLMASDAANAKGAGTVLLAFADAQFRRGAPTDCGFGFRTSQVSGPLVIADRAIVMGETDLAYDQISEVLPIRHQEMESWVALKGVDGICTFICVPDSKTNASRIHDLLVERVQVASRK